MPCRRLLAVALFCALPIASAHAADDVPAAPTIQWVLPWEAGTSLKYEVEDLTTSELGEVRTKARGASTMDVRITQASKDGFVQVWTGRDYRYDVLEGDKSGEAQMRALGESLGDLPLEVDLDAAGNFARVRNLATITPRLREAMRTLLSSDSITRADKSDPTKHDPAKHEDARKKAVAEVDALLDRLLAPRMLEGLLTRNLQTYNGFVGIDLEPDQAYELETQLPNPTGGAPFPAKLTVSLSVSEDDSDDLYVVFDQTIDPEKGGQAIIATGEKLVGRTLTEAEKKDLPKILVQDEGLFVVHRPTGTIEMFEATRTTEIGDKHKVERHRMRQLDGVHEHEWNDEDEVASDDAESKE